MLTRGRDPVAPRSAAPRPTGVRPPRLLVWVSLGVVAAGVTMGVLGALRTGISWDEPFHVMRLRNYFEHGWFSVDWSTDAGGSATDDNNTLVYAPVAMLLLHALGVLFGIEDWGTVATTPTAYDVRHLGVVLLGLVGVAAAAGITRILLRSWSWAAVTAAALLALPMWTGHLMFNIKDVPVASGYTLTTLALVAMASPTERHRPWRIAALVLGATLMVGTRPAMWVALLLGVVVVGYGRMLISDSRAGREVRRAWGEPVAGAVGSWAVLAVVYPNVFADPVLLLRSASQSSSFRENDGWGYLYLPFHLVAQFPLLLQGLAAVGLWVAITRVVRRQGRDPVEATRLALVTAQVLALPLVAFAKNSDLYNGLRQLLFASPAWAVLVTLGIAHVLGWAALRGRTSQLGGLAAAALVLPVVTQATLFPYQYTYWNVALEATGAHVASDYWRTSVPELLPSIPSDGQIICGPTRSSEIGPSAATDEDTTIAGRYSSDSSVDCRVDPLGPLSSSWRAQGLPLGDRLPHDQFYVVIDRDHALPSNCTQLASVTRQRHWREVSMTYLARCRLAPSPIGEGATFVRAEGENMEPALWSYAPEGWVMRESTNAIDAAGGSASLTFRAPTACDQGACALEVRGEVESDLRVTVNDEPGRVVASPGGVTVPLPPGVADAWVTFTSSTGEPLGLRVRSIRVIPTGIG